MRLFIGIDLPGEIKHKVAVVKELVLFKKASWVAEDNIHLTLKFLGETGEQQLEKIKERLHKITDDLSAFNFKLSSFGAFPSARRARVFWISAAGAEQEFQQLSNSIDSSLQKLGFQKEKRRFHAHITLARLREIENIVDQLNSLPKFNDEIKVSEVTLFQSKLSPKGAQYSKLAIFQLKNEN